MRVEQAIELGVLALAAARLSRVVAEDDVSADLREKVTYALDARAWPKHPGTGEPRSVASLVGTDEYPPDRHLLSLLIECGRYCVSWWVGVGFGLWWLRNPRAAVSAAVPAAVAGLASRWYR